MHFQSSQGLSWVCLPHPTTKLIKAAWLFFQSILEKQCSRMFFVFLAEGVLCAAHLVPRTVESWRLSPPLGPTWDPPGAYLVPTQALFQPSVLACLRHSILWYLGWWHLWVQKLITWSAYGWNVNSYTFIQLSEETKNRCLLLDEAPWHHAAGIAHKLEILLYSFKDKNNNSLTPHLCLYITAMTAYFNSFPLPPFIISYFPDLIGHRIFNFFLKRFYLLLHERHREREAET